MKTRHGHETTVAKETGSAEIQPRHRMVSPRLAVVLFTVLVLLSALLAALAWTSSEADEGDVIVASANSAQNSHSATLLTDGRVLVTGGWSGTTAIANADLFDPDARTWVAAAPLLTPRIFHAAARLSDGRVLVTGGWDNNGDILTSTEVYDPAGAAWLPAAPLHHARAGHAALTLPDGRVLVVGGCFGSQASGGVSSPGQPWDVQSIAEVYDHRANSWQAAGQLAEGRCWPTATLLADGRVLVVGGSDRNGRPLAGAELYDPHRGSWSSAGRLHVAREGHTATLLPDGQVLVAGGYNAEALASTELYNPAANAWTPAASMRQARAYHTAALLQNGKVLVIGGATGSLPSQDTEAYDPRANTWTPAGPLPAPYAFHLATVLANGRVVVTGRPGSNDPTGNDGYPTPIGGAQTPTPRGTPGIPPDLAHTPNRGAISSQGMNAADGGEGTTPTPPAPVGNVTSGVNTARLYGVHEVSFTLPTATASPYGLSYPITFTPQQGGTAVTVKAFYDGQTTSNPPLDKWVARVYVNRVGTWTWQAPAGASDTPCGALTCSFVAIEEPGHAELHGMLRVTSGNEGKRWYTDDGQTFLPKADTAYRLFMEVPASPQTSCPIGNLPMATPAAADSFVAAYAGSAKDHGINLLRALAFGNWAYSDSDFATPTPGASCAAEDWKCQNFVGIRLDDCLPDLSLYFSDSLNGSSNNLFDGAPEHAQIQTGFYPNLESFQRTDRKLKLLLNQYPSMYIQVLLVTEPYRNPRDTKWLDINATLRTQLWQNMIARWAAFPNVFWSVSNDLGDTGGYPDNLLLADEIGCYWMGGCGAAGNDPWRASRPMSMGHLRNRVDGSISKPWHSYITAYSNADISAQQMDGATNLEPYPTPTVLFHYTATPEPVYNTEDRYEGPNIPDLYNGRKEIKNPDYFFRKLFWSYLLSGGGATYGSGTTWSMQHVYDGGTYNIQPTPGATPTWITLVGLDSIGSIDPILHQARIDSASLAPHDPLIPQATPSSAWTEYERAQAASNDLEILAYIPNTVRDTSTPEPIQPVRRGATENTATPRSLVVDMTAYHNPVYRVTWYEPASGAVLSTATVAGNIQPQATYRPTLTSPAGSGDVVLHISSRCESPNACQPMDTAPPTSTPDPTGTPEPGFYVGVDNTAQIVLDNSHSALGYSGTASWRCERPPTDTGVPGCWAKYIIPPVGNEGTLASADFYFRRNSNSSYLGLFFSPLSTYDPGDPIQSGEGVEMPIGGTLSVVFHPDGDLETFGDIDWIPSQVTSNAVPDLNRWYHVSVKVTRTDVNTYDLDVSRDGVSIQSRQGLHFHFGDPNFRRVLVHTSWWYPTTDLPAGSTPAVWWDELSIYPPPPGASAGMHRTDFQQGLAGYTGNHVAYIGGGSGYNNTALLKVGANNNYKTLLWFNTSSLPPQAVVDEATLELYYTGRDNGNTLTVGAHRVQAEWIDSQVTQYQRKAGSTWVVAGMGSGSDYTASPEATLPLGSVASGWVQLDLIAAVQAWVADPANNHGLVLLQEAASGWVTYQFCSELGWTPCTPSQAPRLVIRYHLEDPAPVKATFQQGTGGYTGANATCLFYSSGNNNCAQFQAGANDGLKSLLRFDLATIPTGKTVEEATLRLFYRGRSNSNDLTVGAYRLLAPWVDSQATWTQRMTGLNWVVPGLGSGSDYSATGGGASAVLGDGGSWVEIDVTEMAQAWVDSPSQNYGLLLRQASAAGYVIYDFCSERGVWPCTPGQAPQLIVWYR